ncbi:MAG: cardiolipin synthase ClsB [Nitrosomonadales bacterium]|nr:MAG: cardiolipin synthase ClsB [Nitrosomonadales bacterium]
MNTNGFVPGNRVRLLRNGDQYFPALEAAIDDARFEVHLQTYIYEPDEIGLRIAAALKRAAARGVAVCLLLDGFGCKELSKTFVRDLIEAGVEVLIFRPKVSPWTLKRHRLRRLHRKIAVVDGRVALVGGINIIDDLNTPGHTPPRVDYAVEVEGPLLTTIRASARRLWRSVAWTHLRHIPSGALSARLPAEHAGNMWAAYVVRDNVWHRSDIEEAYLDAIRNARSEIVIANSYFLPGIQFRHELVEAARRGVRVLLLLQARVEYWLLDYASRALYDSLLPAGIEIYEYHASFMHSKVAVIDGHWATVGSSNIDPFSLLLAREANVVVDDVGFATELREDIENSIRAGAHLVRPDHWKRDHWLRRMLAWAAYGFIRGSLGIIGYPDRG